MHLPDRTAVLMIVGHQLSEVHVMPRYAGSWPPGQGQRLPFRRCCIDREIAWTLRICRHVAAARTFSVRSDVSERAKTKHVGSNENGYN
jgi:hypothetical protein